jgi:hypothetical protein
LGKGGMKLNFKLKIPAITYEARSMSIVSKVTLDKNKKREFAGIFFCLGEVSSDDLLHLKSAILVVEAGYL